MKNFDKYLNRKNALMPLVHVDILQKGKEMPRTSVLQRNEINELLKDGYQPYENGFYREEDGSTYVSVLTKMPKVTLEMIDWWFWWHAAEAVRYQIWYPEMHFDIVSDFGGHYNDHKKSYKERLHLSTHLVTEDVGMGKDKIVINFLSPTEFGFDADKLNTNKETIICAKVGSPKTGVWVVDMCHFVRITDDGVEMRRRRLIPKKTGSSMFHHCSQEYHNLASFLPELYEEEKV